MKPNQKARSRVTGSSRRGGGRAAGGLPAAPGAQLCPEVMQEALPWQAPAQPQTNHAAHLGDGSTRRSYAAALGSAQTGPAAAAAAPATSGNLPTEGPQPVRQPFDVYVVLDFEATCEENRRIATPEIIEFPLVVVDPDRQCIAAEFQRYVRPVVNPTLSSFCTTLTGIQQQTVDEADTFPKVFDEVKRYMTEDLGLGEQPPKRSYCMVTCGDWDLRTMLPAQLCLSGQRDDAPSGMRRWCNLKTFMKQLRPPLLREGKPTRISGMPDMLEAVGLRLEGHHHSGIDDCRNIARVLIELMKRGHVVRPTSADMSAPTEEAAEGRLRETAAASATAWSAMQSDGTTAVSRGPLARQPEPASKQTRHESLPAPGPAGATVSPKTAVAPHRLPAITVDSTRDPVSVLLEAHPQARPLPAGEAKSKSKAMSTVLRHQADKWGVPVTENGFVRLADLLESPPLKSKRTSALEVAQIVSSNDKQRFRMVYCADGSSTVYIIANQGHSLPGANVDMKHIERVEDVGCTVVHGTNYDALRKIRQCGYLSTMTRHHIHFAKGLPTQAEVKSGMRATASVVLYLDVAKCLADGVPLLESDNGVILTPGVGDTRQLPLAYIRKAVDRQSGKALSLQ